MDSSPPSERKVNVILAKGKVAVMIIGALATAAVAFYGAVRKPPEEGAKAAYAVLSDALKAEQVSRAQLASDMADLRRFVMDRALREQQDLVLMSAPPPHKASRGPASLPEASAVAPVEITALPPPPARPAAPSKPLPAAADVFHN